MSVEIRSLTKTYGSQRALDSISFSVSKGEVVGFLGPNGAGKSTTMKILTGYIPADSGAAMVLGMDVAEQSLEVRRRIGYLPEHNPLYLDLYVHEFLQYCGSLYGIRGKKLNDRVAEMITLCGLTREQNKKIEALSRGYRQRVGLAQALLHDPEVLILDEPTSGLDPNQLAEIRQLIRAVSQDKTVIFSTHIMQEVEAICDRAVVISGGTIVADDRIGELLKRGEVQVIVATFSSPVTQEVLSGLTGVSSILQSDAQTLRITSAGPDLRAEIFRLAADRSLPLIGLREERQSLEQVFRELTTRKEGEEVRR
ncbi:MAG: gliding motility-associated ABC transporter ATP-binding subunit GldA [Bacteroidota bacterium]